MNDLIRLLSAGSLGTAPSASRSASPILPCSSPATPQPRVIPFFTPFPWLTSIYSLTLGSGVTSSRKPSATPSGCSPSSEPQRALRSPVTLLITLRSPSACGDGQLLAPECPICTVPHRLLPLPPIPHRHPETVLSQGGQSHGD